MTAYRLRLKLGADEFEAEGAPELVNDALKKFVAIVRPETPAEHIGGPVVTVHPDDYENGLFSRPIPEKKIPTGREGAKARREALPDLWANDAINVSQIADRLGCTPFTVYNMAKELGLPKRKKGRKEINAPAVNAPMRRFQGHRPPEPENVTGLDPSHTALRDKRTLFPSTVVGAAESPRLLISGKNSRKLGDRVAKGPWAGMPLFSLTLEERATCPETCHHWADCYGNAMHMARRHRHGKDLETGLYVECGRLQAQHPDGFVVRLHVLGDFYSVEYVEHWGRMLDDYPALRVFGYTARTEDSDPISAALVRLLDRHTERFAVRWSVPESEVEAAFCAFTIDYVPDTPTVEIERPHGREPVKAVVCPAQTGATACCGSCGLCWSPSMNETPIAFILHGKKGGQLSPDEESVVEPPGIEGQEADGAAAFFPITQIANGITPPPSGLHKDALDWLRTVAKFGVYHHPTLPNVYVTRPDGGGRILTEETAIWIATDLSNRSKHLRPFPPGVSRDADPPKPRPVAMPPASAMALGGPPTPFQRALDWLRVRGDDITMHPTKSGIWLWKDEELTEAMLIRRANDRRIREKMAPFTADAAE